jgi:glutamate--cysteine ligase
MPDNLTASQPVSSIDDLVAFFPSSARADGPRLLGVEHEKIPVTPDGRPIPYEGPEGVVGLLAGLEVRGFRLTHDGQHAIGAAHNGEEVTLEPGLQVELSAPPLPTAVACRALLRRHLRELREVAAPLGIRFLSGGFRPWGRLDEIPWLPKQRYAIMRDYLPRHGRFGHDMMKRTATVQVNLDFADEADAADKMRVGFACSSIVTALYAASPITEGRPNGHKSFRAAVWLDMDEARCGLIPAAFEPGFGYRAYADWAADVPMFFLARNGQYHAFSGMTFRRFMTEGWQGERATVDDWALHLSTVFPEVRLKRTIEMRGADAGPLPFIEGLAALWHGLLDDPEARRAAWAIVDKATYQQRQDLRREVPRAGLSARFLGRDLASLAAELCDIAATGLARLPGGPADRALLEPLAQYARAGRSPADDMLRDFHAHNGDPRRLIEAWELTDVG